MTDSYRVRRIKGDIVEAICKNHFAAMGFQIENAGVEHFATKFANRSANLRGELGGSNVSKIQNYIGHLPDLLIGHEAYDHHFVEAKFRDSVSIENFSKDLLWDYRKQIFGREFNTDVFDDITRREWNDGRRAFDIPLNERTHIDRYVQVVTKGGIESTLIQLPVMFYVITKQERTFSLFLIRFNDEQGYFQTHQAGNAKETASADVATRDFFNLFDKHYIEVVSPVLREVFSADIIEPEPAPSEIFNTVQRSTLVDACLQAALKLKQSRRKGVYFAELLKDSSVASWLQANKLLVNKESLRIELEKCGVGSTEKIFVLDDKEYNLSIRVYTTDFDFYMN
ncbi:hypothetical protein [Dyella sp.]|uniref:hypothetical protein n=1 Tax=Dyella sp. TaxID=1869338 RepID=UPI002ECFBA8B